MSFEDLATLEREHENELSKRRAFVSGATGLEVFQPCELVLAHPDGGEPLCIAATVVITPGEQERLGGVGLVLDEGVEPALAEFVSRAPPLRRGSDPQLAHARIRKLSMTEQVRLAKSSPHVQERTILERMLGKLVWEVLLRNQQITLPEVARIARKGTVPRPLLEQIADRATWARAPAVRRALLSNPKLPNESVVKVLRLAPRYELRLMLKQTAYPSAIRDVARRMLGRS